MELLGLSKVLDKEGLGKLVQMGSSKGSHSVSSTVLLLPHNK